ncbi:hypothetical protein BJF92_15850 [Rhizobium rhizosphaerae]|uniref:Uncharacterized protein n=1 Tax=Xaviernesmea rhizosphaerae TaxID=1672749 RepID=A0A1Q9AM34_9HYPH|nr:hypothetical protein [Xaviernesmea rhizosphaerae]OLP56357.1 hypothetical protein BJF92_15850 [Xaviernesmea rhizosphaerae]
MIAEIDQDTQHNTATVDETAAAIRSLKEDDGDLWAHIAATKGAAADEALRLKASRHQHRKQIRTDGVPAFRYGMQPLSMAIDLMGL